MSVLRKFIATTGLISLMTFASACGERTQEYHADWPHYDTVDEMYSDADLIIEAQVKNAPEVRPLDLGGSPPAITVYSIFNVEVAKVHKGDARPGQNVKIKQLGGKYDGVDHVTSDVVFLVPGNSYLLFLETYPDWPDIPASMLNPTQGMYPLDTSGNPTPLKGNSIKISRADLERIGRKG